jgi:heme oxygenase
MSNPPGTLRDELREKTAHLHRQTEIALDLMCPTVSLEKYLSVLQLLHAVYSVIEPGIVSHAGWTGLGLDMRARRKLPLLEADLAFIEGKIGTKSPPLATELEWPRPLLDSFPAVLGAAYVVEGSTLGGTIIDRHLSQVLGLDGGPGMRFFHGYGDETGTRWKDFVDALNRAPLDATGRQRASDGAIQTFELLLSRA